MGHGETVAARAYRIRSVAVDPPEPARGKDRRAREIPMHSLLGAIEDVTAMTGDFAIVVEWIARMMRKGNEVNRGRFRFDRDVWMFVQRGNETIHDRAAGCVAYVQDPAARVGRLLSPNRRAFRGVIENHAGR